MKKKDQHDPDKPVYMIGVAAKLSGLHPQTLRIYERRKLLRPGRTTKSTRLYSQRDIDRLKHIQQLTQTEGVNLAGVKIIMDLQKRLVEIEKDLETMEEEMRSEREYAAKEIARATLRIRHELVAIPRPRELVRVVNRGGKKHGR